jgi:serine protease Do
MTTQENNMHRILAILMALLLSPAAHGFDQQSLMRVFFSIVLVRGYNNDGSLAYGSGIVVGENQVVTNCHVLRKTNQAWVSQGEEAFGIVSVQVDAMHDLCLLNTDRLPIQPVALGSTAELGKGDEVVAIGHSNGVPAPLTSRGQVKSLYPYQGGNVVRTNARFSLGASGSALLDGKGRLIGINTFKTPGRAAYFYAVPIEWLSEVARKPVQTTLPVSGQAFWELPDEEKPFFMQVALPQLNEDWSRLQEISRRWIEAEPQNAEAWYELGTAQEGLKEPGDAEKSYRHAAELNPRHSEALYRLGVFASQRGDRQEMHSVSSTLANIDSELAAEFDKAVGCPVTC